MLTHFQVAGALGRITILALIAGWAFRAPVQGADQPPTVGEKASEFKLNTVEGEPVELSGLLKQGPVVLLVLRGWPGYQCPICNRQVGEFLSSAAKFKAAKASLVLVYPGPAAGLKDHAQEFIRGKTLPDNFYYTTDPDYAFTNAYHLRWDAPKETAYPSTFLIGQDGLIQFAKISTTHGGRASAAEVLQALAGK